MAATKSDVTRNQRNGLVGTVVGDKMDKTITVLVERIYMHPKYGKYVRKHKKYHAHDERNEAKLGDKVELVECRPMSRTKRFRLARIAERAGDVQALVGQGPEELA